MVTEDQLTVKAVVLLQKWVTLCSLEHTDMHRKTNSGNIFYFFSIYLPFATFMSPKDLHTFPIIIVIIIFFLLKSRIPSEVSAQAPR